MEKTVVKSTPVTSSKPYASTNPESHGNNCNEMLSSPAFAESGGRQIKHLGKWAAGADIGGDFMPVLYFLTYDGAKKCVGNDMEIRKWTGSGWKSR